MEKNHLVTHVIEALGLSVPKNATNLKYSNDRTMHVPIIKMEMSKRRLC